MHFNPINITLIKSNIISKIDLKDMQLDGTVGSLEGGLHHKEATDSVWYCLYYLPNLISVTNRIKTRKAYVQ